MKIAYPLYLDVPMMVSVLATLEDGITADGPLAALGIDLEGRVASDADRTAQNAIAQRHTVASLFDRLRARLADEVRIVTEPGTLGDVAEGDFVEIAGSLLRNPIYEFVNVVERLFAIMDSGSAQGGGDIAVPDDTKQVFNALRTELERSSLVDATMVLAGGLTGIVAFQKAFLRDASIDELRFGRVRVLGKAVGTLAVGQTWNVLRRSFVGHMVSGAFDEAVSGLQGINPGAEFPLNTVVGGPALFVVPLAVYI